MRGNVSASHGGLQSTINECCEVSCRPGGLRLIIGRFSKFHMQVRMNSRLDIGWC